MESSEKKELQDSGDTLSSPKENRPYIVRDRGEAPMLERHVPPVEQLEFKGDASDEECPPRGKRRGGDRRDAPPRAAVGAGSREKAVSITGRHARLETG
jgi:hypothetical protein